MCEHGKEHVISHYSMYICVLIGCTCAGMIEYLFTINSVIRGDQVYKDGWDTIGKVLTVNEKWGYYGI